jgi:hypothetical protein
MNNQKRKRVRPSSWLLPFFFVSVAATIIDFVALVASSVCVGAEVAIRPEVVDGVAKLEVAAARVTAETSKMAGRRRIGRPFRERLTRVKGSENLIRLTNDSTMPR